MTGSEALLGKSNVEAVINNGGAVISCDINLILPFDSLLNEITISGAKPPYSNQFKFGIYKIFNRYGLIGFFFFLYCYLTIFIKSLKDIFF